MEKLIDGELLRAKVHQMIARTARTKPMTPYERGYMDSLAKVEALIDRMRPAAVLRREHVTMPGRRKLVDEAANCLEALKKAQEERHKLEVHNIGNVDIPDGVTEKQFYAVMSNVVEALEHTDKGEAWPYDKGGETPANGQT